MPFCLWHTIICLVPTKPYQLGLFLQPTLMHNSITTCSHITILDMFRALTCPSSGGTTAQTQHLVSSGCTLHRLRADCSLLSTGVVYSRLEERGYQMLCLCSCSSGGWACQGPKHVEDSNVTYTLLLNCALKLVEEIILYYDARSKKHQTYQLDNHVNPSTITQTCPVQHNEDVWAKVGIAPGSVNLGTRLR